MKYYSITDNISRGIEIKPVEKTDFTPCKNPKHFKNKEFVIYNRKWVPDIFGMNCIGYFVVSEKFKKVLEDNHFTGYELIPIKIKGLDGKYYILVETNIAKNLTPKNEDLDLYVDLKDLGKADFSRVANTSDIVVNEKVLNALKKAKIKNLDISKFENLSDEIAIRKFYQ